MFACGRVVRELGREGIVPWSKVFASSLPFGTPLAGIGLRKSSRLAWMDTQLRNHADGAACTLIIFAFPPGDAYTFVVNMVSGLPIPSPFG